MGSRVVVGVVATVSMTIAPAGTLITELCPVVSVTLVGGCVGLILGGLAGLVGRFVGFTGRLVGKFGGLVTGGRAVVTMPYMSSAVAGGVKAGGEGTDPVVPRSTEAGG